MDTSDEIQNMKQIKYDYVLIHYMYNITLCLINLERKFLNLIG